MKKLFCLLLVTGLVLASLTACGGANPAEIQSEFLKMLEQAAGKESVEEVGAYLDQNLKKVETNVADQMVIAYEDYIFAYDSTSLNYRSYLERFGGFLSEPLAKLYEIKAEDQETPLAKDTILALSWRQICDRAAKLELFIKENKDNESVKADAVRIYETYINAMLMGTTGTPVFSYETGQFAEAAQQAYFDFSAASPDTVVTDTLNEYFAYLEGIEYHLNYRDATESKVFFDTCSYLVSEAGKKVSQ